MLARSSQAVARWWSADVTLGLAGMTVARYRRMIGLEQWAGKSPVVEGASYDRASGLTYVTTGSEITGFAVDYTTRTVRMWNTAHANDAQLVVRTMS